MSYGYDKAQAIRKRLRQTAFSKVNKMTRDEMLKELARLNASPILRFGYYRDAIVHRLRTMGHDYHD